MANRRMNQFAMSLEANKTFLFASGVVDSDGEITLHQPQSKGVASISHQGTGDYIVFLQDVYVRFLDMSIVTTYSTGVPSNDGFWVIQEAVADPAAKGINFGIYDHSGAQVDPNAGAEIALKIILSNSTAP